MDPAHKIVDHLFPCRSPIMVLWVMSTIFFLTTQLVCPLPQLSNVETEPIADFENLKLQPIGGMVPLPLQKNLDTTLDINGTANSTARLGISHGTPVTDESRVPYQLFLLMKAKGGVYECGGVIISQKTAVTAAHCVFNLDPRDITAYAGKLRHSSKYEEGQQILIVSKVTVHPLYVGLGERKVWENDVAHLTFGSPIQFNHFVSSIPLPPPSLLMDQDGATRTQNLAGLTATASGWGLMPPDSNYGTGEPSRVLQTVDVTILSNSECVKYNMYNNVTANHICTNGADGSGTCQGDSGGPLVVKNFKFPNGERGPLLVGLTSFSIVREPCGWDIFPNVYTRISSYVQWIREIDQNNNNLQYLTPNNDHDDGRLQRLQTFFGNFTKKLYKMCQNVWALFWRKM